MRYRIYVDTSVIGGCHDPEFSKWSNLLFNEINRGKGVAVISDLTLFELEEAPRKVKDQINKIPSENYELVNLTPEAEALSRYYIREKAVGPKHIIDAQHIALATVNRVDLLVSWNFKQIVNISKIHAFNAVNLKRGYPILEIRSPREVVSEEEI